MLLELIKGVSLLLALSYLLTFNARIWGCRERCRNIVSGLLFGGISIVGMMLPFELLPGVIFDARSVILSMAGLFGGPLVSLVAGVVAVAYRVWLGGGGAIVGVVVIVSCVLMGLGFRHLRLRGKVEINFSSLLIFGVLVHLVVIGLFTQLPPAIAARVIDELAIPFLITFAAATPLLGLMLLDIENRERTETALRESEARLSLHLQNTPLAAISWDENFLCTQWNKAAEEIFGFSEQEALGKSGSELVVPPEIRPDIREVYASLLREEGGTRNTNENVTKDGRTIVCEWYNTPIRDRSGRIVGVASLALDVTERERTERDLQTALAEAEQANRAKSDFLARLSHELRTPLNAIIGFSDILKLKMLGPLGSSKYEEYAENINDSGKLLLDLINDVLDISAIEAGRRTLNREPVDISELVSDGIETVAQQAAKRGVSIVVDLPDDLPTCAADRRALIQVMLNLLTNAIKFSKPDGRIVVSSTRANQEVTISVADDGIGIDPETLPTVTDVFSRGRSNAHLAQEGTGLGLSIVKSLVEAHGGTLSIDSKVGEGTTVRFTIPVEGTEPLSRSAAE